PRVARGRAGGGMRMRGARRGLQSRAGRLAAIALAAGLGLTACAGTGWPGSSDSAGEAPPAGDALAAEITALTTPPRVRNSAGSVLAVGRATGEQGLALNPTAARVPGSSVTSFTTAAALEHLGAGSRVMTPVHGLGELRDGVLGGGLALVGAGDFSFGL